MAFGRPKPQQTAKKNDGEQRGFFPTNTIPLWMGARREFILLPDNDDPQYPEAGSAVYAYWMPVVLDGKRLKTDGKSIKRRVFMDKQTRKTLTEEGLIENPLGILFRTFMNVYDLSRVIVTQNDPNDPEVVELAYETSDRKFATGFEGDFKYHDGKPAQNKRVMILEAPFGLIESMEGLPDLEVDSDGEPLALVNMSITATSRMDGKDRKYSTKGTQYTGDTKFRDLPRYNVTEAFAPYPIDALRELAAGREFNDVIKEYNINRIPKIVRNDEQPF